VRLVARYLTKVYRRAFQPPWEDAAPAIDRVSFSLDGGETLAIVGAAGSGKTTLARVLAGAEALSSGTVLLDDERCDPMRDPRYQKLVRLMSQDPSASLNPHYSVGMLLDDVLRRNTALNLEDRQEKIAQTLLDVGLVAEHADFYPYMLTAGQKYRIALARAIITDPRVIIADESLSSIDLTVRAKLVNLLLKLQQERNISYIIISHDRDLIRHVSDKVLVMRNGRAVEYGPVEQVLNDPKDPYSRQLLTLIPTTR